MLANLPLDVILETKAFLLQAAIAVNVKGVKGMLG
jgi:hypothetical protein